MFFLYTPQDPSPIYYDPEAAFREYQRREYIKQLQEEAQREQYERELELEQERHRAALEAIARKKLRRQREAQLEAQAAQARAAISGRYGRPNQPQQTQYQQRPEFGRQPQRPSPQEVLARRLARQRQEEERSRQFHQDILSQIFGIPPEELGYDEEPEEATAEPTQTIPASTTKQPAPIEQSRSKPVRRPSQATQIPVTVHPPAATYTYALPARQQTQSTRQPLPATTAQSTTLPTAKAPEEQTQPPAEAVPVPDEDTILTDEPLLEIEDTEPHWSAAPERAQALDAISAVDRSFNALKDTFVFPSGPLERLPNGDTPRLAYNSTNAIIHAYEHALSDLLGKLDGIESHGFKGVREARKQLIVKIEKELEALDGKIAERLASGDSTAEKIVSIPVEVLSQGELSSSAAPVEPAPVKESEDVEMKDGDVPKETPALANITAATPSLFREDTPRNEPIDYPTITPSPAPASQSPQPAASSTEAPGAVPKDAMDIATETAVESTQPEASKPDAPSATNPALVALPETTSDEEEEIADACLVGLSDYESDHKEVGKDKAHASAVGEFEMV